MKLLKKIFMQVTEIQCVATLIWKFFGEKSQKGNKY